MPRSSSRSRSCSKPGSARLSPTTDIAYRGFRDGVVYLAMQGACSGCPSSTATLKQGIEGLLKHYVPEVTEVRAA
jgi:Fe-S cluster biogenesis protein NfuA